MKRWLMLFVIFLAAPCLKASATCYTGPSPDHNVIPGLRYFSENSAYTSNPLTNSDPRLLKAASSAPYTYYMYYPNGHDVVALGSNDMLTWCLASNSVLNTPSWGAYCPGVFWTNVNGTPVYYLFYVKSGANAKSIGVATGSTPLGDLQNDGSYAFTQQNDMFTGGTSGSGTTGYEDIYIDDTVFLDSYVDSAGHSGGSGNVYMYYKHKRVNTYDSSTRNNWLMAVQLSATATAVNCGPVNPGCPALPYVTHASATNIMIQLYTTNHMVGDPPPTNYQAWESGTIEHPTPMIMPNAQSAHRYYLLYNGANWTGANYAVGYATSSTPDGSFTRASTSINPILAANGSTMCSMGSPNPILDTTQTRWLIYRMVPTSSGSYSSDCSNSANRRTSMNVLNRNGSTDVLSITPTLNTAWPTQPKF